MRKRLMEKNDTRLFSIVAKPSASKSWRSQLWIYMNRKTTTLVFTVKHTLYTTKTPNGHTMFGEVKIPKINVMMNLKEETLFKLCTTLENRQDGIS